MKKKEARFITVRTISGTYNWRLSDELAKDFIEAYIKDNFVYKDALVRLLDIKDKTVDELLIEYNISRPDDCKEKLNTEVTLSNYIDSKLELKTADGDLYRALLKESIIEDDDEIKNLAESLYTYSGWEINSKEGAVYNFVKIAFSGNLILSTQYYSLSVDSKNRTVQIKGNPNFPLTLNASELGLLGTYCKTRKI